MRHRRVTVPPIPSSPSFRLWQRLVMVLLGLALVVAVSLACVLYLYLRLSSGGSPGEVLTDRNGGIMRGQIEGRSPDLVKMLTLDDGQVHFFPIADLTANDQALVKQMPVSLTVRYPFESTLTNQHARTLPVMILGRTADAVNFIRLSDHHSYTYAIAKLSAVDQDFVRSLPLSAPVSVALPAPAQVADAKTGQMVAQMQDLIASMLLGSAGSGTSGGPEAAAQTDTPSSAAASIFDPLPGVDTTPVAATSAIRYSNDGEAELAHVVQVYQQIANVTSNLEQSLSTTNPADDVAVEQQLLAAQTQLQQLYQQNGGAAPAAPAPPGD